MRFGLQKLTLLDYPGKIACTVFSCGCNFRCPFCHNATLVSGDGDDLEMDYSGVLAFLKKRAGILEGVCFTGGEFLLSPLAAEFAAAAHDLGFAVKIDTNGSRPEQLAEIIAAGNVDCVAMDIKNSPAKYPLTCGCGGDITEKISSSIGILMKSGIDYEFRTTVTGNLHELSDFTAIGEWIAGAEKYFLQPFAPSGEILDQTQDFSVSAEFLERALEISRRYVPSAAIRGR